MGGDITIRSKLGVGTAFTATVATGNLSNVRLIDPVAEQPGILAEANEQAMQQQTVVKPLTGTRILLAEDCADNQRLIAVVLKKAGAEVVVVENGRLAIEQLTVDGTVDGVLTEPSAFDVVLTDMQMPELDGYTAARILRAKGIDIPVIALTAHAMSGEREKCLAAGCADYSTKPINRENLIQCVSKWTNRTPQLTSSRLS